MPLLCDVIEQTGDLTLLTDGERRYGSLLFEICSAVLRTGKRGRPKKTLRKGVKVRLKNKGSQRHKRGPKGPKYQAPYPEHPDTAQPIATKDIHAHHLEAFNTSLRRRCAAYRRRTNTYAKIRHDSKRDWMSTGLCIISSACTLQPVKYLRWHEECWSLAYLSRRYSLFKRRLKSRTHIDLHQTGPVPLNPEHILICIRRNQCLLTFPYHNFSKYGC